MVLHWEKVSDSILENQVNPIVVCIGAFGNVRVFWIKGKPNQKYAIKCMKKADIIKSKHVDHIENEKKILERIEHPFIVRQLSSVSNILIFIDGLLRLPLR